MGSVEYSPGTVWIEQYAQVPSTLLRILRIDANGTIFEYFEPGTARSTWTHTMSTDNWEVRLKRGNFVEISPATWTLAMMKGTWDGTYQRLPV